MDLLLMMIYKVKLQDKNILMILQVHIFLEEKDIMLNLLKEEEYYIINIQNFHLNKYLFILFIFLLFDVVVLILTCYWMRFI